MVCPRNDECEGRICERTPFRDHLFLVLVALPSQQIPRAFPASDEAAHRTVPRRGVEFLRHIKDKCLRIRPWECNRGKSPTPSSLYIFWPYDPAPSIDSNTKATDPSARRACSFLWPEPGKAPSAQWKYLAAMRAWLARSLIYAASHPGQHHRWRQYVVPRSPVAFSHPLSSSTWSCGWFRCLGLTTGPSLTLPSSLLVLR